MATVKDWTLAALGLVVLVTTVVLLACRNPAGTAEVRPDLSQTPAPISSPNLTGPLLAAVPASTARLRPAELTFSSVSNRHLPMAMFPETDAFTTNEASIYVTYRGELPATGLSVSPPGMQAPFAFKGGTYPGIGGTCGSTITSDCKLVITFTPRDSPGNTFFNQTLKFAYHNGLTLTNSAEFRLVGRAKPRGSIRLAGAEEAPPVITLPNSLVGATATHFMNTLAVSGVARNVHWIQPPRAPFRFLRDDCDPTKTYTSPAFCYIHLEFSPTSAGPAEQRILLGYDDGFGAQTFPIILRTEAFSPTAANVLVVFNSRSAESVGIKDYYLSNRPGFSGVNVMAVAPVEASQEAGSPPSGEALNPEWMERSAFDASVKQPILNWLATHSDRKIGYIVLLHGVPSRLYWHEEALRRGRSTGHALRQAIAASGYKATASAVGDSTPIVTHLSMGSAGATRGYIDKLKKMHAQMTAPDLIISSRNAGKSGSTYFIDDTTGRDTNPVGWEINRALAMQNAKTRLDYRTNVAAFVSTAADVAGYFTWGYNGGKGGDYAVDGRTKFSGNSGWYIIQTNESFNGQRKTHQGNYVDWFSANAFGGNHFANTPIGAVAHVEEPFVVANDASFFTRWENGQLFGDCAWASAGAGKVFLLVLGDPLIRR